MISSSLMAQSFILCLFIFITAFSSPLLALGDNIPSSTISAAPAVLPGEDIISPSAAPPPALSPDIFPVFPSPGGSDLSPSESLPIIPSSPSPPNPDAMEAPGPGFAYAPAGLLPDSGSGPVNLPGFLISMVVFCFLVVVAF